LSKKVKNPLHFGFHRPAPEDRPVSFRLAGFNLYMMLCVVALVVVLGAWLLVKYTPFVTWIGASDRLESKELAEIESKLSSMKERLDGQSKYITILKKKLGGEEIDVVVELPNDTFTDADQGLQISRIALDDTLRRRFRRSNLNLTARTPFILNVSDDRNLEDEFLIPPIRGVVRKAFSLPERHFGVDIIAPENSAVKATLDGLVIESDWTLEGGNTIILQHCHNLISVYKHNSALLKKKGDSVKTGEAIAIIGNTGLHTDGPHVHFELWYNGESTNPESYIALDRD
jgi:murein DD-endopeptidase MepM/ murein hydrolase activator NlpD